MLNNDYDRAGECEAGVVLKDVVNEKLEFVGAYNLADECEASVLLLDLDLNSASAAFSYICCFG